MAKGTCIECESTFRGRTDKKFCSDYCRSQYNNRRYQNNTTVRKINHILRQNYRILKKARKVLHEKAIPLEYLRMEGFLQEYCTHILDKGSKKIHYCYNYGYEKQEDGTVKIREKKLEI